MGFGEEVELIKYHTSPSRSTFYCLPPAHSFSYCGKSASQYIPLVLFHIYFQRILIVYWPTDLFRKISEWKVRIIIQEANKVSQEDF